MNKMSIQGSQLCPCFFWENNDISRCAVTPWCLVNTNEQVPGTVWRLPHPHDITILSGQLDTRRWCNSSKPGGRRLSERFLRKVKHQLGAWPQVCPPQLVLHRWVFTAARHTVECVPCGHHGDVDIILSATQRNWQGRADGFEAFYPIDRPDTAPALCFIRAPRNRVQIFALLSCEPRGTTMGNTVLHLSFLKAVTDTPRSLPVLTIKIRKNIRGQLELDACKVANAMKCKSVE